MLGFTLVCDHKIRHGLLYAIDPFCSCRISIESSVHYFLHCRNFSSARNTFLNDISSINRSIIEQCKQKTTQTLIYGNKLILDANIKYILENKMFDQFSSQKVHVYA